MSFLQRRDSCVPPRARTVTCLCLGLAFAFLSTACGAADDSTTQTALKQQLSAGDFAGLPSGHFSPVCQNRNFQHAVRHRFVSLVAVKPAGQPSFLVLQPSLRI